MTDTNTTCGLSAGPATVSGPDPFEDALTALAAAANTDLRLFRAHIDRCRAAVQALAAMVGTDAGAGRVQAVAARFPWLLDPSFAAYVRDDELAARVWQTIGGQPAGGPAYLFLTRKAGARVVILAMRPETERTTFADYAQLGRVIDAVLDLEPKTSQEGILAGTPDDAFSCRHQNRIDIQVLTWRELLETSLSGYTDLRTAIDKALQAQAEPAP